MSLLLFWRRTDEATALRELIATLERRLERARKQLAELTQT